MSIQEPSPILPQSHLPALLLKLGQILMLCPQPQICLPTGGCSLNLTRSHTILDYKSFAPFLLSEAVLPGP